MILDKIVENKKEELKFRKKESNILDFKINYHLDKSFYNSLKKGPISIIAEVKKASPSKGIIRDDFNPIEIAKKYEANGASAISVLTEKKFFLGDEKYLKDISGLVNIPTLRKDFIIDEFQIYEAKHLGASAILLISEILDYKTLLTFIEIAEKLELDVLCESHSKESLKKVLDTPCKIFGINNRNLNDFSVDLNTTLNLREHIPDDKLVVSESGIKTRDDIVYLDKNEINAVLIGETLMGSANIENKLRELLGE